MSKILYGLTNLENEASGLEFCYRYDSAITLKDNEHSEGGRRGRMGKKPAFSMRDIM